MYNKASDTFLAEMMELEEKDYEKNFSKETPIEDMTLVFVYGSLLEGFGNYQRHLTESEKLGCYATKRRFKMISLGGFPGVLKATPDELDPEKNLPSKMAKIFDVFRPISGEVYMVDKKTLRGLDGLEGNGSFYNREQIELKGFNEPVWMYILMNRYGDSYRRNLLCATDNVGNYSWRAEKQRKELESKGFI